MAGRKPQRPAVRVEVTLTPQEINSRDVTDRLDEAAAELAGALGLEAVGMTYYWAWPTGDGRFTHRAIYATREKP